MKATITKEAKQKNKRAEQEQQLRPWENLLWSLLLAPLLTLAQALKGRAILVQLSPRQKTCLNQQQQSPIAHQFQRREEARMKIPTQIHIAAEVACLLIGRDESSVRSGSVPGR